MKEALLFARDVSKRFSGKTVLDHVSAELYRGDFAAVMGASGAGKSTLLYALSHGHPRPALRRAGKPCPVSGGREAAG